MKTILLLAALVSSAAMAQNTIPNSTSVQQVGERQDSAIAVAEGVVAAGSQATATVPALAGYYCYITHIEVRLIAIAAPVATLMPSSTTNLGGKTFRAAMQAAVGTDSQIYAPPTPLKCGSPGTAATVVGPTGLANVSQYISVSYYYGKI